ncbi:hypothetical protein Q8F55_005925 [Vanrija albida]|uniref:WW domain-containing protein n=1 Tax=Vanrija albida TaxID=181172 RepID=A0ABR3Q375_9TREE
MSARVVAPAPLPPVSDLPQPSVERPPSSRASSEFDIRTPTTPATPVLLRALSPPEHAPPPPPSPALPSPPPPTPAVSPPPPGLPFGARHGPRARPLSELMSFKQVPIRPPRAPLASAEPAEPASPAPPSTPPTSPASALPTYDLPGWPVSGAGGLPPGAAPPMAPPIRFARAQSYDALSPAGGRADGRAQSMYAHAAAGASTSALPAARSWSLQQLPEKPKPSAPPPRDPLPREQVPEAGPKPEGGVRAFLSRILKGKKSKAVTVTPFRQLAPTPTPPALRRAASVSTPNLGTMAPLTPPLTPPRANGHVHSLSETAAGPSRARVPPPTAYLPPTPPNGAVASQPVPNDRLSPGPRQTDATQAAQAETPVPSSASTPVSPGQTHPRRRSVVFTPPPGILLNKDEGSAKRRLQKKRKYIERDGEGEGEGVAPSPSPPSPGTWATPPPLTCRQRRWDTQANKYEYFNPQTNTRQWYHPQTAELQAAQGEAASFYGAQGGQGYQQGVQQQPALDTRVPGATDTGERGFGTVLGGAAVGAATAGAANYFMGGKGEGGPNDPKKQGGPGMLGSLAAGGAAGAGVALLGEFIKVGWGVGRADAQNKKDKDDDKDKLQQQHHQQQQQHYPQQQPQYGYGAGYQQQAMGPAGVAGGYGYAAAQGQAQGGHGQRGRSPERGEHGRRRKSHSRGSGSGSSSSSSDGSRDRKGKKDKKKDKYKGGQGQQGGHGGNVAYGGGGGYVGGY